jgi:hypothetical protein
MRHTEYNGSDLQRRVHAILAESSWTYVLSRTELDTLYELTERLDPRFAKSSREWWESRSVSQLETEKAHAWHANDADSYQKARSYLALVA